LVAEIREIERALSELVTTKIYFLSFVMFFSLSSQFQNRKTSPIFKANTKKGR